MGFFPFRANAGLPYTVLTPTGDPSGAADYSLLTGTISALPARGGVIVLAGGNWTFNHPIVLPGKVQLTGAQENFDGGPGTFGTVINASSTWSQGTAPASAMIICNGVTNALMNMSIQGAGLFVASAVADGIYGNADSGTYMSNLTVNNVSNHGINGTASLGSWLCDTTTVNAANQRGWSNPPVDSVLISCTSAGNVKQGFYFTNSINTKAVGCKAEGSSTSNGYEVDGDNSATGGLQLIGCSSDRNWEAALAIISTGSWPVTVSGLSSRRDGADGSDAAIFVSSTCTTPVVIDGLSIFPGFNDDGSGNQGPVIGVQLQVGFTYVSITNALVHAVTTPFSGTPTNGRAIATRTGTWSSPGAITLVADTS